MNNITQCKRIQYKISFFNNNIIIVPLLYSRNEMSKFITKYTYRSVSVSSSTTAKLYQTDRENSSPCSLTPVISKQML